MKTEKYLSYRHFLTHELEARVAQNSNYTVADFCSELNLRHSRLTEILSGKLGLSEEKAMDIADRLNLSADDKKIFVDLVQSLHGRGALVRKIAEDRLRSRFGAQTTETCEVEITSWNFALGKVQLPRLLETLQKVSQEQQLGPGEEEAYRFTARIVEARPKK